MSALDSEPFPRGALIAASALIGLSLVVTAAGRLARLHAPPPVVETHMAAPVQSIDLRFVDQANGAVSVRDSRTDQEIAVLAPGSNGFVRGVMRGLAHDRSRRGIGPQPPFRLSQWKDGRLVLSDTATGRLIDLDAFGWTNKDAFARLLPARGALS